MKGNINFFFGLMLGTSVSVMGVNSESLFQWLWDNSTDLAYDALNTDFIQGLKNGTLSPRHYGGYMIQDVTYLASQRDNFRDLAERSEGKLKTFYKAKQESYDSYTVWMMGIWRPNYEYHVRISPALQAYFDHYKQVATEMDRIYSVVAMLPCEKLWGWIADEIKNESAPGNVYQFWIDENKDSSGAADVAAILDQYQADLDWDQARTIFRRSMQGEVDFFASATVESEEVIRTTEQPNPGTTSTESDQVIRTTEQPNPGTTSTVTDKDAKEKYDRKDMVEISVAEAVGAAIGLLILGMVLAILPLCCYHHCVTKPWLERLTGQANGKINNGYTMS